MKTNIKILIGISLLIVLYLLYVNSRYERFVSVPTTVYPDRPLTISDAGGMLESVSTKILNQTISNGQTANKPAGVWAVWASSILNLTYHQTNLFDKNTSTSKPIWMSAPNVFDTTSGALINTTANPAHSTNSTVGEWIRIQFPTAIIPTNIRISNLTTYQANGPTSFILYGSTAPALLGTQLKSMTGTTVTPNSTIPGDIVTTTAYQYYTLYITAIGTNNGNGAATLAQIQITGYDPLLTKYTYTIGNDILQSTVVFDTTKQLISPNGIYEAYINTGVLTIVNNYNKSTWTDATHSPLASLMVTAIGDIAFTLTSGTVVSLGKAAGANAILVLQNDGSLVLKDAINNIVATLATTDTSGGITLPPTTAATGTFYWII